MSLLQTVSSLFKYKFQVYSIDNLKANWIPLDNDKIETKEVKEKRFELLEIYYKGEHIATYDDFTGELYADHNKFEFQKMFR